jgi:subtilisin family serine protease
MIIAHSADTMLLDSADPADVDRLNDLLQSHDLGRPLGLANRTAGASLVVPVNGADPARLLPVLRAVDVPIRLDPVYHNGTFRPALGNAFSWAAVTLGAAPQSPPWTPVPAGLRRPVVALLDSGVQAHPWLPAVSPDDPFLIRSDAAALPVTWSSPVRGPVGGHGTFLAGLIRMAAPSARILSLRVMVDDGRVTESAMVSALHWLIRYHQAGRPLDVVCMAFGRHAGDECDRKVLAEIENLLRDLHARGVELVASAGNDHRDTPVFPAAFDVVTAVGAGFGEHHAAFSNYGDWVERYRDGSDVLGILPPDRWVRWSGTSFAAATFAGDVARPRVA